MKTTHGKLMMILMIAVLMGLYSGSALAEKPIVIGCPLATAFLYGWDAERGVTLAIEEINAQGGVDVGGKKRPFKIEVIDTRDLEPGRAGQRSVAGRGKTHPG
jgi:branched-chain amino acid transport system substrate-binding protein